MTTRDVSDLSDHSCGLCGKPNCLAYVLEGGGTCPFDDATYGWNKERMEDALEGILNSNRTRPVMQEATPCSEYTRYTIEGILPDPMDPNKNAVFDPAYLGHLFRASRYNNKKWSEPLSYGIAALEPDIRLHLQGRGKVIIRRAFDKANAHSLYSEVAELMRPSLYCTLSGHTLADMIAALSTKGGPLPYCAGPMMEWPFKDVADDMTSAIAAYKGAKEDLGVQILEETIRFFEGGTQDTKAGELIGFDMSHSWHEKESSGYDSVEDALGGRSFLCRAGMGLDALRRFLNEIKNADEGKRRSLEDGTSLILQAGNDCPKELMQRIKWTDPELRHLWKFLTLLR